MTTRNESRLITRLDRQRESNPHLKWAHLFRRRTVNPVTLRILAAYQDSKIASIDLSNVSSFGMLANGTTYTTPKQPNLTLVCNNTSPYVLRTTGAK